MLRLSRQQRLPEHYQALVFNRKGQDSNQTFSLITFIIKNDVLARFGYLDDTRLKHAYKQIIDRQRLDGGWHPNKRNLPGDKCEAELSCPFGTQNVLRALVVHPTLRQTHAARQVADYLLAC